MVQDRTHSIDRPDIYYSEERLIGILESHNVPWKEWKTRGFRSVADLLDLLKNHKAVLMEPPPHLHMEVHVAVVIIQCAVPSVGLLELWEDRQEITGTTRVLRRNVQGIGETIRNTEKFPYQTALRGLTEELGFSDPNLFRLSSTIIRKEQTSIVPSKKWPGLFATYHRWIFGCFIHPNLYKPPGYVEQKEGVNIFFTWRPADNVVMKWPLPF